MRENVKLSKIDKKGNKQLKLNTCINVVNVLYLLEHNVCLEVKVNKIDGRQTRNTTEWLSKLLLWQMRVGLSDIVCRS